MRKEEYQHQNVSDGKQQLTLQQGVHGGQEHGQRSELCKLKKQLAELEAERDAACRQAERLQSSLAQANSRIEAAERQAKACDAAPNAVTSAGRFCWPLKRALTTSAVLLLLGMLASATTLRNAQSTVQEASQSILPQGEAMASADVAQTPAADGDNSKEQKPSPETRKRKTRFVRSEPSSHRQWGPLLLLPASQVVRSRHSFDPLVQEQQNDLLTLGFDIGEADGLKGVRTEQALHEFKSLYLSGGGLQWAPSSAELATIIGSYARLARDDASRFKVDRGVVAAIRLSSVRTGVDFSYLMELAAAESNFDPVSKAKGSSAAGLYQFTHDTWLNTIKAHGEKYGLGDYSSQIEFYVTRGGYQRPMVRNEAVYQHLLDLRMNPRVSAMMAAETVKENMRQLTFSFDREPARTDLYLTHFLGREGAISFLKALHESPDALAKELFPAAAKSNRNIFHPTVCAPRTVDEVYEFFSQKFDTSHFEWGTN